MLGRFILDLRPRNETFSNGFKVQKLWKVMSSSSDFYSKTDPFVSDDLFEVVISKEVMVVHCKRIWRPFFC